MPNPNHLLRFHSAVVVSSVALTMCTNLSYLTMPEAEWEEYACPDDCAEYLDDPDNWIDESEED